MVLSCRPVALPGVHRPRPTAYWPDDALDLVEAVLSAGRLQTCAVQMEPHNYLTSGDDHVRFRTTGRSEQGPASDQDGRLCGSLHSFRPPAEYRDRRSDEARRNGIPSGIRRPAI